MLKTETKKIRQTNTLLSHWPVLWTHLSMLHRWAHEDHNHRLVLLRHHSELLPQNRPGWVRSHTVSTTAGETASLQQYAIWTNYDTLVLRNLISCRRDKQIALSPQELAAVFPFYSKLTETSLKGQFTQTQLFSFWRKRNAFFILKVSSATI